MEELRPVDISLWNSNPGGDLKKLEENYLKENCIDSNLETKCKSAIRENPDNPSGLKLELADGVEIKSVTIYSPLEDKEYNPEGHSIKVLTTHSSNVSDDPVFVQRRPLSLQGGVGGGIMLQ